MSPDDIKRLRKIRRDLRLQQERLFGRRPSKIWDTKKTHKQERQEFKQKNSHGEN